MKLAMSNIAWSADERLEAYRILREAGSTGLEIAPGLFFHEANDPFAPDSAVARKALAEIEAVRAFACFNAIAAFRRRRRELVWRGERAQALRGWHDPGD